MAVKTELCVSCGAPLEELTPGAHLSCKFCGTKQRIDGPAPEPPRAPSPPPRVYEPARSERVSSSSSRDEKKGSWSASGVLFAVAAVGVLGGVIAEQTGVFSGTTAPPLLRAAELAALSDASDHEVETLGMPGTFAALEPAAFVNWAAHLAQAWCPDATLEYLQVHDGAPDGTVDARGHDGAGLTLAFYSPARRAALVQMLQTTEHPHVFEKLEIEVRHGQVLVSQEAPGAVGYPDPPIGEIHCTLPQAFDAWTRAGLPRRSSYDTTLSPWDSLAHWHWGIHANDMPYLDATTCARVGRN